ncbi:MAG: hypothetical protein C5B52_18615 [Bacteroidetes bacterium]|nr:MAG: hypothetical protein C5B52_18615 [Bacteroidota bacterium]
MAHANNLLVEALRETASRLRNGAHYAWGHHGSCNCGNLLQVVTKLSKEEILAYARTGNGEWTELAEEYCPVSQTPVNLLISKLEDLGLTTSDIHNLEYLEDRAVLEALPGGFRWLNKNVREDVVEYFDCFADILEENLLMQIQVDCKSLLSSPLPV